MAKEKREIRHATVAGEAKQLERIKELSMAAGKSLSRYMVESTLAYAEKSTAAKGADSSGKARWYFTVENGKRTWYAETLPYHVCLDTGDMTFCLFHEPDGRKILVTRELSLAQEMAELTEKVSPSARRQDLTDESDDGKPAQDCAD